MNENDNGGESDWPCHVVVSAFRTKLLTHTLYTRTCNIHFAEAVEGGECVTRKPEKVGYNI